MKGKNQAGIVEKKAAAAASWCNFKTLIMMRQLPVGYLHKLRLSRENGKGG